MKTLDPAELAARLKERHPMTSSYAQHDDGFDVRYRYAKPWPAMTPEERLKVLALIGADLRALAEQTDEARRQISVEELAA